jgi:hypothetical protein
MVNIVQVGLGPLGVRAVEEFLERGMGRIVAVVDPAHAGRKLSECISAPAPELVISGSLSEVQDWSAIAVAVVTTCSALPDCFETFQELLQRRVHVVSSCEELSFPWPTYPIESQALGELAIKAGRSILGTGVNPGFLLDTFPVVLSGVCREVRGVVAGRVQDATTRRIPFQQKIGAALDLEAFEAKRQAGTLRHVGLPESLHLVAHSLGFVLERWEETHEPVVAERPLSCALGEIPVGHAAGVRQVARGWSDGAEVVRLEFQAAIGQPEPRDWVTLDSDPPIHCVIEGGVHGDLATSSILLNSIAALRESSPGLKTMVDVRPPRFTRRHDS